jgi:lipid A disaccharide synthetase
VVERDDVEVAVAGQLQALLAVRGQGDLIAATVQRLADEAAQALVVVDVQDFAAAAGRQLSISGTWITDRKRPS